MDPSSPPPIPPPPVGVRARSTGEFRDQPDHHMARARPDSHLLIWVLGGHGYGRTEGIETDARPGTLLTFHSDHPHAYGSNPQDPWHILWVHFAGPAAAAWLAALRASAGPSPLLGLPGPVRSAFERLLDTHARPVPEAAPLADALLIALLGTLVYHLRRPGAAETADPVADFRRHVRDHLAGPLTAADLADRVHLSARQLTRLTHRHLGAAPMDYVLGERLRHARTLLAETTLPIKRVAAAVGYADPLHFSRLFRRKTGHSPTGYRAAHRVLSAAQGPATGS